MLHVPINIRQIPSPAQSPTVEQKDFIPKDDTAPIVVESVEFTPQECTESPQIGSPNIHSNILTNSMDPSQVCCRDILMFIEFHKNHLRQSYQQNYPMFVTNETTSPGLDSPIVSVSTINSQMKPQDIDEQMERFSETSSIELVIQGGSYEHSFPTVPKVPESHMMQFNHYPGSKSTGHVPIDIVKSYAPVSSQVDQRVQDGGDIYSDYAQDPYNLTLQIDANSVSNGVSNQSVPSASTVFQSSSYFSNDTNGLATGSDLFNRP